MAPTTPKKKVLLKPMTWQQVNDACRNASEEECIALLEQEKKSKAPSRNLQRIHQRLGVMRRERERKELGVS
jgi:hypothetical protein